MRAQEILNKPHLYLDMDGVQADFFSAWAQLHGKDRYKEIGNKAQREQSIDDLNGRGPEFIRKFFSTLPTLPGGMKLLAWLNHHKIPYTVLSSPLRGNHEASIEGKRHWLNIHNPGHESGAVFADNKERWAKNGNRPNVLIDDYKKNVAAWNNAGGMAMLYRDNNVDAVINELEKIYGITDDLTEASTPLKTYSVKVKLKQSGYTNIIDTTVMARTPEMARRLLRQLYNNRNVIVGQPKELK